jgi:ribosomal protein S25
VWVSIYKRQAKLSRKEQTSKAGKAGGRGRPKQDSVVAAPTTTLSTAAKTRKDVSQRAKVSQHKLRTAGEVHKKASPEMAKKIRDGEMS